MNPANSKLSQDTFDRLIARAIQIDEQGKERIDPSRAREIAAELGVSTAAWDAAVREWSESQGPAVPASREPDHVSVGRLVASMLGGCIGGTLMGAISAASSGNDIAIGAALVASAGAMATYEYRRSVRQAQASLAAWWLGAAPGITLLGLREFSSDAMWFVLFAWSGCAAALTLGEALTRRIRTLRHNAPAGA